MPTSDEIKAEVVVTTTSNILTALRRKADIGWLINNFRCSGTLEDGELRRLWKDAEQAIDKVRAYIKSQEKPLY